MCIDIYLLIPISIFLKIFKLICFPERLKNIKTYWNIKLNLPNDNKQDTL